MRSLRWAGFLLLPMVAAAAGCSGSSGQMPSPAQPTSTAAATSTPVRGPAPTASPAATPSPLPTTSPTLTPVPSSTPSPTAPPLLTNFRYYALPSESDPTEIVTASDGNVWFTEAPGNIVSLEPSGTFESSTPTVSPSAQPFGGLPEGLTTGSDGSLWIANRNDFSLSHVSLSGTVLAVLPIGNPAGPSQIAFGSDGNLWFTEQNNEGVVGRMTPTGAYVGFAQTGNSMFSGIVAAPDENLWLVEAGGVLRLTTSGVSTFFSDPTGRIAGPLCVGSDGNLWAGSASASGGPAIDRISLLGAFTEYDVPGEYGFVVTAVYSADGFVYVAEGPRDSGGGSSPDGTIAQLETNGTFVRQYSIPRTGTFGQEITSMTLGSDKNLYLTDYYGSSIDVWTGPENLQSMNRTRAR